MEMDSLSLSPPVSTFYGMDIKDAEKVVGGGGRSVAEGWGTCVIPIGTLGLVGFHGDRRQQATPQAQPRPRPPALAGHRWPHPASDGSSQDSRPERAALKVM